MLPQNEAEYGGSSLAVDFELEATETRVIRFVLSWYAPKWKGGGAPDAAGPEFTHMYAVRFSGAEDAAYKMVAEHEEMLQRIIRWQEVVFADPDLPGWLADALINNLSLMAPTTVWAQKDERFPWAREEEGVFGMNESPRSCSQMITLPNMAAGNLPLACFFPEVDRSIARQYAAYLSEEGDVPAILGYYTWELGHPRSYGYQLIMNGANFMTLLDRNYAATGDEEFLRELYPAAKKACQFSFSLRPDYGGSQLLSMQAEGIGMTHPWLKGSSLTEWWEDRVYHGYQVHAGGFRMAAAHMMKRWAEKVGDMDYVQELESMLVASAEAAEEHLWVGDHYMLYNEPETGRKMDVLFTPSFDGHVFALQHGLSRVFPAERVRTNLDAFERVACAVSRHGIPPTYAAPDGQYTADDGGYISGRFNYVNYAVYLLVLAFLYEDKRDVGMDILHKTLEMFQCVHGYTWDGVHVASREEDDGEIGYGTEYTMSMALWGIPLALKGQDISEACAEGGLFRRMVEAAAMG
jgi:uncharacterized protein (DUF608 family)